MNGKRFGCWFLILALLCSILPGAMADTPESPAVSFGEAKYLQDGFLYEPGDRSLVYYYDYASKQRVPLCTRPNCNHEPVEGPDLNDYHYSVAEFMNGNPSLCYAARFAFASSLYSYVLYNRKLYFFPAFYNDPKPGTNTLGLYVSEVDGETRLLTDLGYLFPGNVYPEAHEVIAYDGYLYIMIQVYQNPSWKGTEPVEMLPGTIQLVKCSMETGEASVMETFYAENCQLFFFGLYNGVLYYEINTANGMEPTEDEWEYLKDTRKRTLYSVEGIDVATGEKVIPDQRLCDRNLHYGERFDIVKDGVLYSFVLPQSAEDNTALFLGYDLNERKNVLEYSFQYDDKEPFFPYWVLTDEIMLSFDFGTGRFARHNLKTGEIEPLSIPGASIEGNEGQTDWYDLYIQYFQTNPLVIDHCYADGTTDKAYITVEELLNEADPQMHDFIGG